MSGCFLLSTRGNDGKPIQPEIKGCQEENVSAPDWICTPKVEGFYFALGIVEESSSGMEQTRKVALTDGRYNLAQQIKLQVKSKVENFFLETELGEAETASSINMQVSREIANVDLSTSTGIKTWSSPSKNLYMLVTLSQNEVNAIAIEAVINSLKNDAALWEQFQSEGYLEDLEEEFPVIKEKVVK